jgi:threonine dehydrogenase-like Zn-dependent dehydrogenase
LTNITTTSDLHEYLGGPTFAPVVPHAVTKGAIPVTFGYKFFPHNHGRGQNVENFAPGQNVSIQHTIYDSSCGACSCNFQNVCYNGGFVGLSGWGGVLSDAVTVPASCVLPLLDNIPLGVAALIEPLAALENDSNILILGGGPIGIAVILALGARGCG